MTKAEMKIKEHTESMENICKKLTTQLENHLENNFAEADTMEVGAISDMIKDMTESKKNTIKGLYYAQIMEAMEDSEYGEDYDEDGRMFYRGRNKRNGQYMHRPYTEGMSGNNSSGSGGMGGNSSGSGGSMGGGRGYEVRMGDAHMRDMDRDDGRMYYAEDSYNEGYKRGYEEGMSRNKGGEGRMEKLRRGYEEAKEAKDKDARIQKLNEMVNNMTEEFTPLIREMDVTEKSILRNGLQSLQNKIS